MLVEVLRILSDLHVYDVRSQVRDLRQLEPLLVGVQTLVLNGDSCEMRPGIPIPDVERLRAFFRERVPEVIFVTGNHDPDISQSHELLLAEGRVWVTHGDIFFDDFTPWSRQQPELVQAVQTLLAKKSGADYHEMSTRLGIAREAARMVGVEHDPADARLSTQLARLCDTLMPPRQIFAMLRAWLDLPALAAQLALEQRPSAQVVVTGHVHFPGVWVRPNKPTVINTGSFFSPLGGHLVDVSVDSVQVRWIRRSHGKFMAGRRVTELPLIAVPN